MQESMFSTFRVLHSSKSYVYDPYISDFPIGQVMLRINNFLRYAQVQTSTSK